MTAGRDTWVENMGSLCGVSRGVRRVRRTVDGAGWWACSASSIGWGGAKSC